MFLQHNLFLQRYLSEMLNVCIAVTVPSSLGEENHEETRKELHLLPAFFATVSIQLVR